MRKLIFPMLVLALGIQACSGGGKKDVDTNLEIDKATEGLHAPDTMVPDHTEVDPDTAIKPPVGKEKNGK